MHLDADRPGEPKDALELEPEREARRHTVLPALEHVRAALPHAEQLAAAQADEVLAHFVNRVAQRLHMMHLQLRQRVLLVQRVPQLRLVYGACWEKGAGKE